MIGDRCDATLIELEAAFIRLCRTGFERVERLSLAQGVTFLCPKCFLANARSKYGVHSVLFWFDGRRVPEYVKPAARWHPSDASLAHLSFVPPTVRLIDGCAWHGNVRNGRASVLQGES
jgi:hypothetical protein